MAEPYVCEHGCGCQVVVSGRGADQRAVLTRMCRAHARKVTYRVELTDHSKVIWRLCRKAMKRADKECQTQ